MTVETLKQFTQELAKKVTFNTENLYLHYINCRGGHYTTKINIWIIDNNAFDYTDAQVQKYIKDNFTLTQSNFQGNSNGLPCCGFAANNVEVQIKNIFTIAWLSDKNAFGVLLEVDGALPTVYILPELTINNQKTITLALNNVNKPSYKTVSTKLSLGGTAESAANVKWTCYKYPLGDGKFKYEWVGNYNQTKEVAVTSGYGSGFMSPKFSIALPDSNMVGKCILYAGQSGSTCWVAPSVGGSSLDFYLLRNTSNTRNDTLEINITCSYVGN